MTAEHALTHASIHLSPLLVYKRFTMSRQQT